MPVHNVEIADMFDELADLLDIEDANPFRIRAYRNAADMIRGHPKSFAELVASGEDLSKLPSIGKDLAGKIQTIVETGRLPLLDQVSSRTPAALSKLMKIEGLGPQRVKALYHGLNIRSAADLERAAKSGWIRELPGFGTKTELAILKGVREFAPEAQRMKLNEAEDFAQPLADYLQKCKGIKTVTVAGSLRRRKETIGDLDILVTAQRGTPVMQHLADYDEVEDVISQGATRSTVRLRAGISVDVRVVPQVSYGAALHYFTGSKAHNIALRKLGIKKGFKINEYGVFKQEKRVAGRTEAEVFASVGLPYIPPELRRDRGEIEAAKSGKLPKLVALEDIRGDLHCHTRASDGHATLSQMADAAAKRRYQYISINDHSQRVKIAHGLDEKRVFEQLTAIDKLNAKLDGISILKSIEVDVLEDGSLDLPNHVLKELDFTVCAVHYQYGLSKDKQTERILRAMDNPYFTILAHPTGRLINERHPYAVDLEALMDGAKQRGCFLELNAHPDRFDLSDDACRLAKDIGVQVAISTDAHNTGDLDYMRYGIDQARRGWLTAEDVINTRPLRDLRLLFKRK